MTRNLECVVLPTANNPEDFWSSHQHNIAPCYWLNDDYADLELDERTRIVLHTPYTDPEQSLTAFKEAQEHQWQEEMGSSNTRRRMLATLAPFALTIPTCMANSTETVNNYVAGISSYYENSVAALLCNVGLRLSPFILTAIPIYIVENIREWPTRRRIQELQAFFQNITVGQMSTVHSGLLQTCAEVHPRVEAQERGQFIIPQEDQRRLQLHRADQPDIVLYAMHENRYHVGSRSLGHLYEKYGKERPPDPKEYEKYIKKKE